MGHHNPAKRVVVLQFPTPKKKQANISAAHLRPSQGGGLVAMGRAWFNLTGGFDEGMHGWGGENLAPWVQNLMLKVFSGSWVYPFRLRSCMVFQLSTHLTMVKMDTSMLTANKLNQSNHCGCLRWISNQSKDIKQPNLGMEYEDRKV